MKRRIASFALPACLALITALNGCGLLEGEEQPPEESGLPAEARAAARVLLDSLAIGEGALVVMVAGVPPGSILRERVASGENPVELRVPPAEGQYYACFIDETPEALLHHPVRFAWCDPLAGAVGVAEADQEMTVIPPAGAPAPFTFRAYGQVGQVHFCLVGGGGAGEPVAPGSAQPCPDGAPARRASADRVQRLAMVIDGGDVRTTWGRLVPAYHAIALTVRVADKLCEDAQAMAAYLAARGFDVERVSQYWDNSMPYFTDADHFQRVMARKAAEFGDCPADSCHELFIFVASHGAKGGLLSFYPKDGGANMWHVDPAGNLVNILRLRLPSCVKLTVFLHACYSGGLITDYNHDSFCTNHCGLTLLTTTDAATPALAGRGVADSPIDDFLEDGAEKDLDSDGTPGDLYDRYIEMVYQVNKLRLYQRWSQGIPLSYHCPSGGSWCSLDGPKVRPPQEQARLAVAPEEVAFIHRLGLDDCPHPLGIVVVQNVGEAAMVWELAEDDSVAGAFETARWLGELEGGQQAQVPLVFSCRRPAAGFLNGNLAFTAHDLASGAIVDEASVRVRGLVEGPTLSGVPILTGPPQIAPAAVSGHGERVQITLPVSPDAAGAQVYLTRAEGSLVIAAWQENTAGATTVQIESPPVVTDDRAYLDVYLYGADARTSAHYGMNAGYSTSLYVVTQMRAGGGTSVFRSSIPIPWLEVLPLRR